MNEMDRVACYRDLVAAISSYIVSGPKSVIKLLLRVTSQSPEIQKMEIMRYEVSSELAKTQLKLNEIHLS